jgi:hypothetical protein
LSELAATRSETPTDIVPHTMPKRESRTQGSNGGVPFSSHQFADKCVEKFPEKFADFFDSGIFF